MPGAFLTRDLVAGAAITCAQATVGSLPPSNLQDPQPRLRMRVVGNTAAIVADLLATRALDAVAAISTTLTATATMRARLSTADATGAAGDAWDTGVLAAATGPEVNGNLVIVNQAGQASGRYLRLDLVDAALAEMDIGRLVAGALWRTARSHDYGIAEGRLILDRRDRNDFTGAEFAVPAVGNPRRAAFTMPSLSTAEARGEFRDALRRLGAAGDALWIPDLGLSQAEMNARSIWGAMQRPGAAGSAHRALPYHTAGFDLVERL